jgi:hypothetical protein
MAQPPIESAMKGIYARECARYSVGDAFDATKDAVKCRDQRTDPKLRDGLNPRHTEGYGGIHCIPHLFLFVDSPMAEGVAKVEGVYPGLLDEEVAGLFMLFRIPLCQHLPAIGEHFPERS